MPSINIEISVQMPMDCIDESLLKQGIERILYDEGVRHAEISLAIVGDTEIHRVNREFLGHDYPTDVISFLLSDPDSIENQEPVTDSPESEAIPEDSAGCLQGELVVSVETAIREAQSHGWSPRAELLLYVVHGVLHLCGYDDLTDEARPLMRSKEREILAIWGFCPTGLET